VKRPANVSIAVIDIPRPEDSRWLPVDIYRHKSRLIRTLSYVGRGGCLRLRGGTPLIFRARNVRALRGIDLTYLQWARAARSKPFDEAPIDPHLASARGRHFQGADRTYRRRVGVVTSACEGAARGIKSSYASRRGCVYERITMSVSAFVVQSWLR